MRDLQLGLGGFGGITLELNGGVGDDNSITFDSTDLEQDLITLAPHRRLEGLARVDSLCKTDLDVLEVVGIIVAVSVEDMLTGNTERAQTMEDGDLKASDCCHLRVNVERVPVSRETVERSLILACLLGDDMVGLAAGDLVGGCGCTTVDSLLLAAKVAGPANEHSELVDANVVALPIRGLDADGGDTSFALVQDVDDIRGGGQLGVGGERPDDLEVLLAVKEHHGVERREDFAKWNAVHGRKRGDYTESRDGGEGLAVLINEVEIGTLGADTEVVKDDIALGVGEGLRWEGQRLCGLDINLSVLRNDLGTGSFGIRLGSVLKVGNNALHRLGSRVRMGGATVLKVGDLVPLLRDVFGQQVLVNGEPVAAGTLPAELADITSADLKERPVLGGLFVAEVGDQGGDHLGLEGGEHVWGQDGLGHARGGDRGNDVAVDIVLLALESKRSGEADQCQLGSRVIGLTF